jgi:curved DNA-binding protein CbpA
VPKNHYQVLGIPITSTAQEVRSAYRQLVLKHHPDRSSDPKSGEIFLAATEAYKVLGDAEARKRYDAQIALERRLREKRMDQPPPSAANFGWPSSGETRATASSKRAEIREEVVTLSHLFSRGRYSDAEVLAQSIIQRDPRQAVPYAILGDIARMRGNRGEALKLYAYAAQFDPRNPTYQRRYEDLLNTPVRSVASFVRDKSELKPHYFAGYVGIGLVFVACAYLVLAKERPLFPSLGLISTWTVGLIVMLFFMGVTVGACLSIESLIDSFGAITTNSVGKRNPTAALATLAVVNFWLAVFSYVLLGVARQSFNFSTTRVVAASASATCLAALSCEFAGRISGIQVLLWGGNFVYLGALCGWLVSDALRTPG